MTTDVQKTYRGFAATPTLWKNTQFSLKQFEFDETGILEDAVQSIPGNLRLGQRLESVFKHLLEQSANYDLIAHNLQLKKQKTTIGEIDYLIGDRKSNTPKHIELTYKFYCIDTSISEPIHRLMGPNRKDMFFTKMEKIRTHQFPLLYSNEAEKVLHSFNLRAAQLAQEVYYKAQLYIPFNPEANSLSWGASLIRPLNADCITGQWMRLNEFKDHYDQCHCYLPKKYEWVHQPHLEVDWQSHFDTVMEINLKHINERSPLIWVKHPTRTLERLFVVWW
ncbi:hypothetical protein GCM10009117_15110 [Gangjinia marincola]|uniref:DUF1853 family protein n=1 Tax=Gangjinia marincola TaxID=578463 RepID=A0ABN1MGP9_9FLAO